MRIDRDLVRRVEHSGAQQATLQAAALATVAPGSGATAVPLDGGALVAFGHGRYVNRAMGLGLNGTSADEIVATINGFYSQRRVPPSLEICPWADPTLFTALGADGYRLERFRNVYAHDLTALPSEGPTQIATLDADTAAERKRLLAGDTPVGSEARRVSDEFCDALTGTQDKVDLLALVDGMPAACGSLTVVGSVGWLGGAATDPARRGRGLQSALVAHRLRLATEMGCTLAAATALPDGQSARNLERLGFTLLYTQAVMTRA